MHVHMTSITSQSICETTALLLPQGALYNSPFSGPGKSFKSTVLGKLSDFFQTLIRSKRQDVFRLDYEQNLQQQGS